MERNETNFWPSMYAQKFTQEQVIGEANLEITLASIRKIK